VPGDEYYSGGGEKTIIKCVILEKYLRAYLNIMTKPSNWRGPKWYVDTHAGTGFTQEYEVPIPGSTLRALNFEFDRFYLYEKDEAHFKTLVETLNQETQAELEIGSLQERDTAIAYSDDPYVRVFNMDCNEGVSWLVNKANHNSHWFTFVDPERFSVERKLMEQLRDRANMDILFNFQTEGFFRNASENADHSHEKVASNLGDDFPRDASHDELVEWYEDKIFRERDWYAGARTMESGDGNQWRYDLIFATQNANASRIMGDIYNGKLKDDVASEVAEWRQRSNIEQTGLGFKVYDPDERMSEDEQAALGDF